MGKTDFLSDFGVFFSFPYFLLVAILAFCIFKIFFVERNKVYGFLLVFAFYFFVFITNHFFDYLPFYPDTVMFYEMIVDNVVPKEQSKGVQQYYTLTAPLRVLSFYVYEFYMILIMFFSVLCYAIIWKAFSVYADYKGVQSASSDRVFVFYIILVCFYPANLLFLTIPLREWVTLFGFSLLLYSSVLLIAKKRYRWVWFLLAFLVLIIPRPIMAILPLISLSLIYGNVRSRLFLMGVAALLIPIFFEFFTHYTFSPEFFSYLRNASNERLDDSGMVYGQVMWGGYFDMLADLPVLLAQFLLSPLPIMHSVSPFTMKAHLLDALFVIVVLLFSFLNVRKFGFIFTFFIVFATLFSAWEFFIGGAVRHRLPLVSIILPVAALGLSYLFSGARRM